MESNAPNLAEPYPLQAYATHPHPLELVRAERLRDWQEQTTDRFALLCLPMVIANQAGWVVLGNEDVMAEWNGGTQPADLKLTPLGIPPQTSFVSSHFGHGILTINVPYVFRTPPGIALLARGPANSPLDGASPLEGIVETDWNISTFTMNWKLTRPGHKVLFKADTPICMVVPFRLDLLERAVPRVAPLERDPDLQARFDAWSKRRRDTNARASGERELEYFKGQYDGVQARVHRTRLELGKFVKE